MCDLFCQEERIEREFGTGLAKLIRCRLAVLQSTETLDLLPREPPIAFTHIGDGEKRYAIALGSSHRLEFEATDSVTMMDRRATTRIRIIGVKAAPASRKRTP